MPMRTLTSCAVCALALTFSTSAYAQFVGGVYLRGDLGWSWGADAGIKDKDYATDGIIIGSPPSTPGKLDDIGDSWLVGVGVGTRFSPQFRGDVVYTYRGGYELDDVDQAGFPFNADVTSHSVMANAYWDIALSNPRFMPFIGAGIGWAHNTIDSFTTTDGTTWNIPEGSTDNFAWQAMAGVGIALSPQATLDIFYRYFDGGDIESESGDINTSGGSFVQTYSGASGDLQAHEIVLSLRFSLGGP